MPGIFFQGCEQGSEQNKTPVFVELLKKFPVVLSKQMGEGRYRELDSLSGVLRKPPSRWQTDTNEKKIVGTCLGRYDKSNLML